jgi:hypothetical protein
MVRQGSNIAAIMLAGAQLAGAQMPPGILAVDRGHHIEPVAFFEDARWTDIPSSGLGRLAPRDWTRWSTAGVSSALRLAVREPIGRCRSARWLSTSGAPRARASAGGDYFGIATTRSLTVDPVAPVTAESAEWSRLDTVVAPIFEKRAREHNITAESLARVPMTVDWAYAAGSPVAAYYFEASKRIPDAGGTPAEDPLGVVRIGVSGWLRVEGSRLTTTGTRTGLHWESEGEPSSSARRPTLLPVAVIRQAQERIWVMSEQTGARERFVLYAVGASSMRRVVAADAAEC